MEECFNTYFNSDGVREALWAWLWEHQYQKTENWTRGVLRYCAEGNLYAVLEEWAFVANPTNPNGFCDMLKEALTGDATCVYVQTQDSFQNNEAGVMRKCSFAEQLTLDIKDNGAGANNKEKRMKIAQHFSSPFWPMILFAGRNAQEGLDFHQYCLRIMHMTLPRGAVSLEQRQGRIDRYRSLLVRRRAAEYLNLGYFRNLSGEAFEGYALMKNLFARLICAPSETDQLYPNFHLPPDGKHFLERMMPSWPFSKQAKFANICTNMLESYRVSMGSGTRAYDPDKALDLSPDQYRKTPAQI